MTEAEARSILAQGHELYGQSRWEAAIVCFSRLLELSLPEVRLHAWHGLAAAHLQRRDSAASRQAYQRLLELDSEDSEARYGVVQTLLMDGAYQEALPHLNDVLLKRPDDKRVWAKKGAIELGLSMAQEAIVSHKRCLSLDPRDELTWTNLGVSFLMAGQPEQAQACWQKALEIAPGYPPALQSLKQLQSQQGRQG